MDIIRPYAHRAAGRKLRQRTKQLLQLFETNNLCVPSTYFRPRKGHTIHTWRGSRGARSQIDYIVASRRWRSCFYDSKVYWNASRFLSGKETDHGLLVAKFRWRLRQRARRAPSINWARLKPPQSKEEGDSNPYLDSFEKKCRKLWETQTAEAAAAAEADSQDGEDLGGRGQHDVACRVAGTSSAPPTRMTTGPSSMGVGTGVVMGADEGSNRACKDTFSMLLLTVTTETK